MKTEYSAGRLRFEKDNEGWILKQVIESRTLATLTWQDNHWDIFFHCNGALFKTHLEAITDFISQKGV